MANINQFRFGFGQSAFDKLSRESTQVGSPELPLLNTSDDNRQSVFLGGDVRATNLALWSEEFDNDVWGKNAGAISENATSAPNSTLTADKLIAVALTSFHSVFDSVSIASGEEYTISLYAKASEYDYVQLRHVTGINSSAIFDLVNGTVHDEVSGAATIEAVGSDWYRCSVTATATATGDSYMYFNISADGSPNQSFLGDGTSGIFIWGAMLNTAATALPYVKTGATAVTAADLRLVNGIFVSSSLKGDENDVDTDLTAVGWLKLGTNPPVVTHQGGGVYRVTFAGADTKFLRHLLADLSLDRYGRCEGRLISGSFTDDLSNIMGFRTAGGGRVGDSYSLVDLTSSWQVMDSSVTSASQTARLELRSNTSAAVIEIRTTRAANSKAPAAGFTDLSPAGTDYLRDLLTFLHTYTATTTFQIPIMPYGWSDDGNPADAEAVLLEAGAFQLKLSPAGFIETSGGAVSTKKLTADTLSVITVECDGVNHTIQVDGETPVVAASAIVPSGTSYVGNLAAGTNPSHAKPSHAMEHISIYGRALTVAEVTTGEDGYQARLGSMVLV